jgi:hypothetical protein
VGLRAGLDTEDRGKILSSLPGIEPPSPGRPVCSQTLYCLSYPGSHLNQSEIHINLHVINKFYYRHSYDFGNNT